MTAAIEDQGNRACYAASSTSSGESTPELIGEVEPLRARHIDDIISVPHAEYVDMLELVARSTPLLFIDRYIPGCAIPAVISNSAPGIKAALKALASRGHKKVGYLAGPQTPSTGLERLKEFQRFSE